MALRRYPSLRLDHWYVLAIQVLVYHGGFSFQENAMVWTQVYAFRCWYMADVNRWGSCINMFWTEGTFLAFWDRAQLAGHVQCRGSHEHDAFLVGSQFLSSSGVCLFVPSCQNQAVTTRCRYTLAYDVPDPLKLYLYPPTHQMVFRRGSVQRLTNAPPTTDLRRGLRWFILCSTYFGCLLCNLDDEEDRCISMGYVDAFPCRGLPPLARVYEVIPSLMQLLHPRVRSVRSSILGSLARSEVESGMGS
ncbi:hypothetical protein VNO77_03575 [Canavalia gladiata]|uniref:Uncharacterized protein n=1 Tax=Canavalia gladiata TaxID=3824 RepID=A0AAN9N040_CANGL